MSLAAEKVGVVAAAGFRSSFLLSYLVIENELRRMSCPMAPLSRYSSSLSSLQISYLSLFVCFRSLVGY